MARKQQLDGRRSSTPDSAGNASPGVTESTTAEAVIDQPTDDAQDAAQASNAESGNVSALPAGGSMAIGVANTLARAEIRDRLLMRDDWRQISKLAKEMRSECNRKRMAAEDREDFVWSELDRLYPPEPKATCVTLLDSPKPSPVNDLQDSSTVRFAASGSDSGRVQGLGDLPPGWPELPANASLAAEIGWVQANRLYVVEELDRGGTRVHLDRAHEPAPSRAAIGWLETSIRSYAKYVEVAAKATGAGQDEQAQERQERMDLEDVRSLLAEMI